MFTAQDNDLLMRVGPGTPMGDLFRRFWVPFMIDEELAEPDATPKPVTLLGEELLAFRDSDRRIGLVQRYCAHRRVDLYYGRNEECGLRCAYHGWKYDVEGRCVDMPSEPADSTFKDEVRLTAYPTREWGGVIWAYMGPAELQSEPPQFEWGRVPAEQRYVGKRLQETNYAAGVEGGIDSSHVSILHSLLDPDKPDLPYSERQKALVSTLPYLAADTRPKFFVNPTDYGFLVAARRAADAEHYYWRISQFLMPFYTIVPRSSQDAPMFWHSWTPIDDERCWVFTITWSPDKPLTLETRDARGVHAEVLNDGSYRPTHSRQNEYLIDREVQRTRSTSGIEGIGNQDSAIQESMGATVDRSKEMLGSSDTAIVAFRKLLLKSAQALQEGKAPKAPLHPEWYRVRSGGVVVPKNDDFKEAARDMLIAEV